MTVSKSVSIILIAIAGLFVSGSTFAVLYVLPSDGNWYQVQSIKNNQTICSTDDAEPCNLLPGSYELLEFNLSGNISRTPFMIEDVNSASALIVHVSRECVEAAGSDCNVSCPVDYLPSGLSCAQQENDGSIAGSGDLVGRFDSKSGYCESSSRPRLLDFSAVLTLACVRR